MSSSEASNYVNMETIDKVQDGKIYFNTTRFLKATDPSYSTSTLVPAEYNQDINKETYEIVRDLLKYARQYDGYVNAIYDPSLNGTVTIEYYESSEGEKYKYTLGYNTFGVYISVVPEIDKGIEILYPSEQKEKSFYQWDIGRLCTAHYLIVEQGYRGRNIEEDLTKFDYTEDSHTEPLKSALINIYGENQGTNFFDFVIDVKYKCAVLDNYTDKFIGYKDSIGCQLIYINGEVGSGGMFLKTSKVGEKI